MPTNGQFVVGEIVSAADANQYFSRGSRNMLINGDFRVAQRGTSFTSTGSANNDDTYNLDRWVLLSDGNDVVDVTQSTTAPADGLYSIGLDVETANKKFGILQIVEQRNIVGAIGQIVTLSFQARISGTSLSNVKAVVLSWSGTADTVTSDVVSAWGADGVTPTWASNWTAENTPSNLAVTTDWTTYRIQATVDTANTRNLAVFIWNDDTSTTLGDFLYVTDVQLEIGAVASPFDRRAIGDELALCQRYYYRNQPNQTQYPRYGVGQCNTTNTCDITIFFPTTMRISPTSLEQSGTASHYAFTSAGFIVLGCSAVPTFTSATQHLASVNFTITGGYAAAGNATVALSNNTTSSYLAWSAEL